MQPVVAKQRRSIALLAHVLCLLCLAGCNLDFIPEDRSPSFEGPPVIHIAAPLPDQTFLSGTTVIVQARVENAGPDIARIAVLLNDELMGEQLNPNETSAEVLPLTIDWPTSNEGDYTITVIAERGDGSVAREDVSIMVIARGQYEAPEAAAATTQSTEPPPTADQAPSQAEEAGPEGEPAAAAPATATSPPAVSAGPSQVSGIVLRPAPLRPGPGVDSGQPIGNLMADAEVLIIAVNPERNWYRIRHGAAIDAWVDASLITAGGDLSGVAIETGAPPTPEHGINLVVTSIELAPDPPVCGQQTVIRATVRNSGAVDAQTSPWVAAKAYLLSDQSVQAQNPATIYLPTLAAGEEVVLEIPLTLTARFAELHEIRVTVDEGNHVIEVRENDNTGTSRQFELSQGACSA